MAVLGRRQLEQAVKAGAAYGAVLKHSRDLTMGNVYKIMPEWKLRDIGEPDSDYLLDHLKHRATTSFCEQYREGVNGGPGDVPFILESMRVNGLRHVDNFRYKFTLFFDGDRYGQSFEVKDPAMYNQIMAGLSPAVDAGLCVPQSTG